MAENATKCALIIRMSKKPEGYWEYLQPGWAGLVTTLEVIWEALGMLSCYKRINVVCLLEGVIKAYDFFVNHTGFQKGESGYAIDYFAKTQRGLVPNNTSPALAFLDNSQR